MGFIDKLIQKLDGYTHKLGLNNAKVAGAKDDQEHLQRIMERMYSQADQAALYSEAKVAAAVKRNEDAEGAVRAQLEVIKAAQHRLNELHDAAATAQHELAAERQSRDAFLKLLPKPGVSN